MINKKKNNGKNNRSEEFEEKNLINPEFSVNSIKKRNKYKRFYKKYSMIGSKIFYNSCNKCNLNLTNHLKIFIALILIIYFISSFRFQNFGKTIQNEVFIIGGNRYYLNKNYINKFNTYLKICSQGILIDKQKYPLLEKPKISIVIPIYNGGKYLYYSLRSIQNQKLKDIEIILIDDKSTDDSISIIEEYMKEDPRIKLIQNIKNRKILYSKSLAALNSNGKYIFQFDQDDILIRDDVLTLVYNEAEKHNLDLVNIRDIYKTEFYFYKRTRVNTDFKHVLQFQNTHYKLNYELKNKLYNKENNFILWGLLIKTDLYKKAVYNIWSIIMNYQLIFFEDHSVSFLIVLYARKYKYLNNFCIIHLDHKKAISNKFLDNKEFFLSLLFFFNNIYDYYLKNNSNDFQIIINFIKTMKYYLNKAKKIYPKLFHYILRKLYLNKILSYNETNNFLSQLKNKDNEFNILEDYNYLINSTEYNSIVSYENSTRYINTTKNKNNKIEISIIILYTDLELFEKTIKSIENQQFENFEIILIYDNNNKTDFNNIKKYTKLFSNIKLINNKEEKGLYYSYSEGITYSNGVYILTLESGITLAKSSVLNDIYNNLINDEIDILEFNILVNYNEVIQNNSLSLYRCKHFKSEIDLSKIKYNKNYKELDQEKEILSNKVIKSGIIKNIINKYISIQNKNKIFNYFDDIIFFLLNKENTKFKHIDLLGGIKYIYRNKINLHNKINYKNQIYLDSLFYINFLFENSEDSFKSKSFVLNEFYNIMNIIYNKFNTITEESKILLKKFINCKYISSEDKETLKFYYHSLIN